MAGLLIAGVAAWAGFGVLFVAVMLRAAERGHFTLAPEDDGL